MKLIELHEDEHDDEPDREIEMLHAVKQIKKDCQPFLKQFGGHLLYRGSPSFGTGKGPAKFFQKRAVRTDRNPLSTDPDIHRVTDEWFKEKFGIAGRSGALFTTGGFIEARGYGTVYCIFPIGEFKFVWSPTVRDLFVAGRDIKGVADAVPYLEKAGYKDTDLAKAIKSGKEIMVDCKEYYMVMAQTPRERDELLGMLADEDY